MADLSWMPALSSSGGGGGGGGVSDYDQLTNRPVTNITGSGIVINSLSTGVYNIRGTWKMTSDDEEHETGEDDLFYVLNTEEESKMTWITAGGIKTFSVESGGTAEDVVTGNVATTENVSEQLVSDF